MHGSVKTKAARGKSAGNYTNVARYHNVARSALKEHQRSDVMSIDQLQESLIDGKPSHGSTHAGTDALHDTIQIFDN